MRQFFFKYGPSVITGLMILALVMVVATVLYVLVGWPPLCAEQLNGVAAAASALAALAMFVTAFLILRQIKLQSEQTKRQSEQIELQSEQTELQSEHLSLYYRPNLWLRVDYSPDDDKCSHGLPIRVYAANEGPVFDVVIELEETCGKSKDITFKCKDEAKSRGPASKWESATISRDADYECGWILLGPWNEIKETNAVRVEWRDVTGYSWERVWTLEPMDMDEPCKSGWEWHFLPPGKTKRVAAGAC